MDIPLKGSGEIKLSMLYLFEYFILCEKFMIITVYMANDSIAATILTKIKKE